MVPPCPPPWGGGWCTPFFAHVSRNLPNERPDPQRQGAASAAGAADQRGGPVTPQGARELSRRRCSTKSPPTGGERAPQQDARSSPQPPPTGGGESSAGGAPAPSLQPQGARELSRRRSSAKPPTTGGARAAQQRQGQQDHSTLPRGAGDFALERLLLRSLAPCGCRFGAGAPPAELSRPLWLGIWRWSACC